MLYFLLFLLGISVGSFLNVVIDRIPRGESILKGRSYCEDCKKVIKWYDLIPLLSFISLKGKCRSCSSKLSFYYPFVELITGIIFVLIYIFIPGFLIYYLFIASAFIAILFTDLKYGIIPDQILYSAIIIVSFFTIFTSKESWLRFAQPATFEVSQITIFNYLFSAIASFLFFLLIFLITKGKGMGFGDVKLAFLMGLFLGFPKIIPALYLAFLTGAITAIILVLIRRKKFFGGTVPFGPFLILGTMISYFWGKEIINLFFKGIF